VTFAPVGLRCPDHASASSSVSRATSRATRTVRRPLARRGLVIQGDAIATRILVGINVLIYLITVAQGAGLNNPGGSLFNKWILFGPYVEHGDWWRLVTAMFLHGFLLHLLFNMWALWVIGTVVEGALGTPRFVLLYFVSGLAGSAGALVLDPTSPVVGASGAIFGLFGAGAILEWRATGRIAGQFLILIAINLAITFTWSGISAGGHVGGLIGGLIGTAIIVGRGRFRTTWDVPSIVGLVAVGVLSVLIAYWKVRGLA
jgi:membrane associated rhomboid family serine protease